MHYCVHLLTKTLPTKDEIAEIMQPYNSEFVYGDSDDEGEMINYPTFTWDWYQIGGRYKAALKLKVGREDSENYRYYSWGYYDGKGRNGRLFWSSLLSTLKENASALCMSFFEEKWFMNMGFADGYILVDGAWQKDVINLNTLECYICILPDGSAIARNSWDGTKFIGDEDFEQKYKQAISDNMDGFITVIDIHD